jgi:predicted AAA+ superfamily ATPase
MTPPYIPRSIEPLLRNAASEFPAVVLTGPRQSGKTTTLKEVFGNSHHYLSLEPPDVRAAALEDPRGLLAMNPPPVILDEAQYAPELLPYVKEIIDNQRSAAGQFIITGSQNLLLMERTTESLAGRAAVLRLLPMTNREIARDPGRALRWEREASESKALRIPTSRELWEGFIRGYFPELIASPRRDHRLWHSSYAQTYLERDVRNLRQIGDLTLFQAFLRAVAARSAQLLSLTDLARDLGIAVNTVKAWIAVLEATHQILILRPYFANIGKRLVKRPKVYFTDVGTLCHLTGVRDLEHAASGPMAGPIFETAVVMEVYKTLLHRGVEPRLSFWRTSTGSEVDLIVEEGRGLIPIEIKLSSTPRPAMAGRIRSFRNTVGEKVTPGYVIHPGDTTLPLGEGVTALPFAAL